MRIVCPACTAAYEVPPTLLKPGQVVRCARCAREWVPSPAALEAQMEASAEANPTVAPVAEPAAEPTTRGTPDFDVSAIRRTLSAPPPERPRSVAPRLAWAASIVAVLLLGWGAYAGRSAIMHAWPPSIRLYAALGLTADR